MRRAQQYLLDDRVGFDSNDAEQLLLHTEDDDELIQDTVDEDEDTQEEEDVSGLSLKIGIFLTRWPHKYHPGSVILIEVLVALLAVSVYGCYRYHPPSEFINNMKTNPQLGFSTRGTEVMKALWTARKLYWDVIMYQRAGYSPYPNETLALNNLGLDPGDFTDWLTTTTPTPTPTPTHSATTTYSATTTVKLTPITVTSSGAYQPIGAWHTKMLFAFEPNKEHVDLWSVSSIREVCSVVQQQILPTLATTDMNTVYTLGTVVGNIYKKKCHHVTHSDVRRFRSMFIICLDYDIEVKDEKEHNKYKTTNVSTTMPQPEMCSKYYEQLRDTKRFLIPEKYSTSLQQASRKLDVTLAFLTDYAPNNDSTGFYNQKLYGKSIQSTHVVVTGYHSQDGQLKLHVYEEYMIGDTQWFFLAITFVFLIMFAYLRRVDVLLATILMILMSCIFSYAFFYFIIRLKFFPVINLLAILIIIAVGSDDVFVFYDIFQQTKEENQSKPLEYIVAKTFRHAFLSLFVTSLTTSAAFFANAVSNITNIKIFGIFAGSAILVNFATMILFVPSVIVITELMTAPCANKCTTKFSQKITSKLGAISAAIFHYALPKFIEKCWHICIILLSLCGISSFIIVFVKPGFQLPMSDDFQVFKSSNVMEHWDLTLAAQFLFAQEKLDYKLLKPYFIFGFIPMDPGDHMNPLEISGNLTVDERFDLYDADTQLWMQDTCNQFKKAPFGVDDYMQSFDCAFDAYATVAQQVCAHPLYGAVLHKCCESKQAPFKHLEICLPFYQAISHNKVVLPGIPRYPRPILDVAIFHPKTNKVVGYVLHIKTHWYNTYNYDLFAHYYYTVQEYFVHQQEKGPATVQHGFMAYTHWSWFWDLQNSLYTGTYYSIGMSLAVSTVVMLMTSLNVLITCYAMVTIAMAIASTVAAIVLMGWSLSVIESVIISLSVGLSIDFTIHYGMAYRLSKKPTPNERVRESFKTVGAAVAMAALTTLTSGAAMLPCRVLPYLKLGMFLMLVMTFAWIYATFFFQSVCRIIGPRGNFCQIRIPKFLCAKDKSSELDPPLSGRIRLAHVDCDDALLTA